MFNVDISQLGKYISKPKLFSNNTKLIKYFKEILSTQTELGEEYIDRRNKIGICCISSIWNCFPKLLNNDKNRVTEILESIKPNVNDVDKIISEINKYFNKEVLQKLVDTNQEMFNKTIELLNKNMPVVLGYQSSNINHGVSIFGYDDTNFIYFENDGETLLNDTSVSLFKTIEQLIEIWHESRDTFVSQKLEWYYDYWQTHKTNKMDCFNYFKNNISHKEDKLTYIRKDCFMSIVQNVNLIVINPLFVDIIDFSELTKRLYEINFNL